MQKLSRTEWDELRISSFKLKEEKPHLRIGQCLFNLLYENNHELADSVRGTQNDPFYSDDYTSQKIKDFYDAVVDNTEKS